MGTRRFSGWSQITLEKAGPPETVGGPRLSIRMVAGFAEVIEGQEFLVAGACNRPNCLVLPLSVELIRLAA